jgi:hypothetical protein
MYWLAKINRIEYKIVFYEELKGDGKKNERLRVFAKEKLPEYEELYEFGFFE